MILSLFLIIVVFFSIGMVSTAIVFADTLYSPLKQMKNGIPAEDVICKNDLQLMIKSNDTAICVKSPSVTKITDSGFATVVISPKKESTVVVEEVRKYFQEPPITELIEIPQEEIPVIKKTQHISIHTDKFGYRSGDTIIFEGVSKRNQNLEVTLNDPNENEVFVEVFAIPNSGKVYFEIPTDESFVDGTYFLIAEQISDSEIIPVIIGAASDDIQVILESFYHELNSDITAEIYGTPSGIVNLVILDMGKHTKFQDTIKMSQRGFAEYPIDTKEYSAGVYSIVLTHGTEEVSEEFGIGLETQKTPLALNLIKEYFVPDESVLIYGTSSNNSRITLQVIDPNGELVHEIESYTDSFGKLSSKFKVPANAISGEWKIQSPFYNTMSEINFEVISSSTPLDVELNKTEYIAGEYIKLDGYGADSVTQVSIIIMSDEIIEEINIFSTSQGNFSTIWKIPMELESGVYTITVDDDTSIVTTNFTIVGSSNTS